MIRWRTYQLKPQIFNMRFKKVAKSAQNVVTVEARRTENETGYDDTNA